MKNNEEVRIIEQLRGYEGMIKQMEDGTEQIHIDNNIINGSGNVGQITQQDLQDLFDCLACNDKLEGMKWVVYTGHGGYVTSKLQYSWRLFGNQKLPRKMKKRYFMKEKDRRRYLPQYYKN